MSFQSDSKSRCPAVINQLASINATVSIHDLSSARYSIPSYRKWAIREDQLTNFENDECSLENSQSRGKVLENRLDCIRYDPYDALLPIRHYMNACLIISANQETVTLCTLGYSNNRHLCVILQDK
ncbi:hypothetical protein GJ496_004181 [Pomphorhynchus laevis]|nr:hypothetical protein GJ496_004181 [Pomphorhynchus laevis]